MSAVFEMPEVINGEEPPATVPFVKPESAKGAIASSEPIEIKHQRFASLDEAAAAYDHFSDIYNWNLPRPSMVWFIYASEQNWGSDGLRLEESDPGYVTFDAWREIKDPRWVMDMGDLIPSMPATSEEVAIENGQKAAADDSHDEKFWRELEIMGELRAAEMKRQEAQTAFDVATEERKEAKEHLASCTAAVARVTAKLVGLSTLPAPKQEAKTAPADGVEKTAIECKLGETAELKAEPQPDDSWRKEPTANIIKGLPGLGAKKFEAICELAPTVGDLEDLRGKASEQHKGFKELLPDGCGEAIAQRIEDASIEYVSKWSLRTKPEATTASTAPAESPATEETKETKTQPDDLADL